MFSYVSDYDDSKPNYIENMQNRAFGISNPNRTDKPQNLPKVELNGNELEALGVKITNGKVSGVLRRICRIKICEY